MKRASKSPPRARLQFEQLEGRLPLAGNVIVQVTGANLKITGDDFENNIAIFGDANHVLHIQGIGTGVTIKDNKPLPASDSVGSITADFKKALTSGIVNDPRGPDGTLGVDTISIKNVFSSGPLSIKGSNGGVVTLGGPAGSDGVVVQKSTTINFSKGNGISSVVNNVPLGSQVNIENCDLGFDGSHSPPSVKGCTIATKDNKDHVELRTTNIHGNLTITTKGDNDEIGLIGVFGFFSTGVFDLKGLKIDSGAGDDIVALTAVDVGKTTSIKTGDGNDKVIAGRFDIGGANVFRGAVTIDTGKGNDIIGAGHTSNPDGLRTTFLGKITLKAGSEDDKLMLGQQLVVPLIKHSIDGGANNDTLEVLNPPFDPNDTSIFKNWETRGGFVAANLLALAQEANSRF